jgi:hypothetical protein
MAKKTNTFEIGRYYRCTLPDSTKKEFFVLDMPKKGEATVEQASDRKKATETIKPLFDSNTLEEVDPDEIGMTDAKDVARWLARELYDRKVLDQDVAVAAVRKKFGNAFVVQQESGNFGLAENVRRRFRKEYDGWADWNTKAKCWEARKSAYMPPDED